MYEHSDAHWLRYPGMLIARYEECARQVNEWYKHLHPSVQFSSWAFPGNELAFYLQGRFFEWRSLLLRPFLYCLVNSPSNSYSPAFQSWATEYIKLCGEYIHHISYHGRHGGTWFTCRSTFAYAMLILAAVASKMEALRLPEWLRWVQLSLRTLRRWAPEARDVEAMHVVLSSVMYEVCQRDLNA